MTNDDPSGILEPEIIYDFTIQGFKKKKKDKTRFPIEDPEGVDTTAFPRTSSAPGGVSLTKIAVHDLISEGRIEGLVTGTYVFSGNIGDTGWASAVFLPYDIAPGTSVRWLRSVLWNEVPVVDSQNRFNFQDVNISFTPGLPNGTTSNLLSSELTKTRAIGERLRYGSDFAKIYRILNKNCKAVEINIRVNQLSRTNQTKEEFGDIEETTVKYILSYKPLFSSPGKTPGDYSSPSEQTIRGKITNGYIKSTRINLFTNSTTFIYDQDFVGWEIKIQRTTEDSITSAVRNQTFVDSLTEVYGNIFTYPNSAIVGSKFSAEYFSQVPSRAFDTKGLRVKIPSNYDPIKRSYTNPDDWDGTFKEDGNGNIKKEWTDNPAWCFYDILTNRRYGLGQYIDEDSVDKWNLYKIGQYCDVLVSDGYGGIEPRFSCNLVLLNRENAYDVINNMASIFRAMVYYGGGAIFAVQDAPKEVTYEFTNANVENGDFQYASSSKRVRHSVAIVRYNDKTNFYKPAIEYIEDFDAIRKYGIRELEIAAFGCTSRGQALRFGRWALLTETLETETISFTAGLEASLLRPGDVFKVFDYNRRARRHGGRTNRIYHSGRILLDSEITGLNATSLYHFSLLTPTFYYDPSLITGLNISDYNNLRRSYVQNNTFLGNQASGITGADGIVRTEISFNSGFQTGQYVLSGNLIWMIEGSGENDPYFKQFDYYRVIRVQEKDSKYVVAGVQYAVDKYKQIESGIDFQQNNNACISPTSPENLQLNVVNVTANTKRIDYKFSVPNLTGINKFLVYGRTGIWNFPADFSGTQYLVNTLPTGILSGSYTPSINHDYYFLVYSLNNCGQKSTGYASGNITIEGINPLRDVIISSLTLDDAVGTNAAGSKQTGIFTDAEPVFVWQVGANSTASLPQDIYYRVTAREPSPNSAPSSNLYYEETGILKGQVSNLLYEFTMHKNRTATSTNGITGPFREFDFVVEAMDKNGNSSAGGNFVINDDADYNNSNGYDILYVSNPRVTGFRLTTGTLSPTDIYHTEQSITNDGDVRIRLISGSLPEDVAGGYLYVGNVPFTKNEAYGLIPTTGQITRFDIVDSGNPLVTIANLTGVNEAYIAVSFYDLFDQAILSTGIAIATGLEMSNVAKVYKRNAFVKNAFTFKNWIEVTLDYRNQQLNDWWKYSAGISGITFTQYFDTIDNATRFKHNILFTEALPTNEYVVFGSQPTTKNLGSFTLERFTGKHFFGVLHV